MHICKQNHLTNNIIMDLFKMNLFGVLLLLIHINICTAEDQHNNAIEMDNSTTPATKNISVCDHPEKCLLSCILKDYNPLARPMGRENSTHVKLSLALSNIESLISKSQILTSSGFVNVNWKDNQLIWNPQKYGGIRSVVLPAKVIWLPKIALLNTAENELYNSDWFTHSFVNVEHNGQVTWQKQASFNSKCHVTIMRYPFDEQYCELVFGSLAYLPNQVTLSTNHYKHAKTTLLSGCKGNSEWLVLDGRVMKMKSGHSLQYSEEEIHFILQLKRKPLFHMVNIIAPSFMLSGLVLLVFQLPADSGEKISLGITLLLSFSVLILMIAESLPVTSEAVPLIVVYLIFIMALTTLAVIISTIVLIFHHKHPVTPPPKWLDILIFQIMGKLCCRVPANKKKSKRKSNISDNDREDVNSFLFGTMDKLRQEIEDTNGQKINNVLIAFVIHTVLHDIKEKQKKLEAEEVRHYLKERWQTMAIIMDRFSFWTFLVIVMVGSPALYHCFAEAESPLSGYF